MKEPVGYHLFDYSQLCMSELTVISYLQLTSQPVDTHLFHTAHPVLLDRTVPTRFEDQ